MLDDLLVDEIDVDYLIELIDYKKIQDKYKKEYGKKYKRYILKEVKNKYGKLVKYKVIESQSRSNKIQWYLLEKMEHIQEQILQNTLLR